MTRIGGRSAAASASPRARPGRQTILPLSLLILPLVFSGCGARSLKKEFAPDLSADRRALEVEVEHLALEARHAPDEPYWPLRIAEAYVSIDSLSAAESYLVASLDRDSLYAPALSLLSYLLYKKGWHEEGMELLEKARASGGDFPEVLAAALALHYEGLGETEKALATVDGLRSPGPHWTSAGSAIVFVQLRSDDYREAATTARNALIANPQCAANHNNYGITLLYSGDPSAARESFHKAVELDPELPGPLYNLAIVEKFYFFDDEAAIDWFDRYRLYSHEDPDGIGPVLSTKRKENPVLSLGEEKQ